jgi:hypothetical protein
MNPRPRKRPGNAQAVDDEPVVGGAPAPGRLPVRARGLSANDGILAVSDLTL